MKQLLTIISLLFLTPIYGQTDTLSMVEEGGYTTKIYNPQTKTMNNSYDYSDKYDFDGDGINDSLWFIGNGGVHVYYYPKIVLSATTTTWNFPTIQIDFPYEMGIKNLEKSGIDPSVQFVAYDFDGDQRDEIFLNFDNDFSSIPLLWRIQGINAKQVILNFEGKKLICKNYHN